VVSRTQACTFPYLAPFYKLIGRRLGTPMNKAYLSTNFSFGMIPNGPDFVCKNMKIFFNELLLKAI
jgi:hypothetical protein